MIFTDDRGGRTAPKDSSENTMHDPPEKCASEPAVPSAQLQQGEITRVLDALSRGEADSHDRLLRLVYAELHRLAQSHMRGEAPRHSLEATALIHEAYIRLLGGPCGPWENRAHFFTSASEVMRRILVDQARRRHASKRGGDWARIPLNDLHAREVKDPALVIAVDEALTQLAREDAQLATIVKLRFFSGLSSQEIAAALGLSLRTVEREWRFARARLVVQFSAAISGGILPSNTLDEVGND